jgi:hypothetical protein
MRNIDYFNLDTDDQEIVENPNGSISFPALLTRTGIFKYQKVDPDGTVHILRQLRLPDEVFADISMNSLRGLPLTNNHPPGRVINPENATDYIVGMTSGTPKRVLAPVQGDSEEYIRQTVTVVDGETLKQIKSKKKMQFSLGYQCQLDFSPGVYKGQPYDCIQRNIRNNHGSVVTAGRAGPNCRIIVDDGSEEIINCDGISVDETPSPNNKERKVKVFNFDGKEYQVEDGVHSLLTAMQSTIAEGKSLATSKQKELDKTSAICDSLKSQIKTQNDAEDTAKFHEAVKARVSLEAKASSILGESVNLDSLSDREVREKVITKSFPEINLDGRSDDYIEAMYDIASKSEVEASKDATFSRKATQNDSRDDISKIAAEARKKAWDRDANLWKGAK